MTLFRLHDPERPRSSLSIPAQAEVNFERLTSESDPVRIRNDAGHGPIGTLLAGWRGPHQKGLLSNGDVT